MSVKCLFDETPYDARIRESREDRETELFYERQMAAAIPQLLDTLAKVCIARAPEVPGIMLLLASETDYQYREGGYCDSLNYRSLLNAIAVASGWQSGVPYDNSQDWTWGRGKVETHDGVSEW